MRLSVALPFVRRALEKGASRELRGTLTFDASGVESGQVCRLVSSFACCIYSLQILAPTQASVPP